MSNKTINRKKSNINKSNNNVYLFPLLFVIAIVPLIVRVYFFNNNLSEYPWASRVENSVDIFLHYKSIALIISSIFMIGFLIFRNYNDLKSIKVKTIFIPLGAYALLAFISSVFSKYSYFSFHGMFEQFESIWVVLSYCLITYYAVQVIKDENDIKNIMKWLIVSITIISLIGLGQAFSFDFFRSKLGRILMSPSSMWSNLDSFQFTFEAGRVYSTLFNPNYIGSYVALVVPIILMLLIFSNNKKYKIGYLLILITLFICLFASQSRTGMVAIIISLIFLILLLHKLLIKKWKLICIGIAIMFCTLIAVNTMNNNRIINRFVGIFSSKEVVKPLSEIQTNDDNITFIYNNETLVLRYDYNKDTQNYTFMLEDKNGNTLSYKPNADSSAYYIDDERFKNFLIGPALLDKQYGIFVQIDSVNWYFTNQTDGTYYYYTRTLGLDKINNAKSIGFKNLGEFGSGRGYIWSRTLPLLKQNIFIGSGPDTFALEFPNDDYVGLTNYGFTYGIMTKPHNMYLQLGVQSGVLSLIAFLVFYAMYLIMSFKTYYNCKIDSYISKVGIGILIGTIGYMITGIANDSSITVAPVFWALIGVGISINCMINNSKIS